MPLPRAAAAAAAAAALLLLAFAPAPPPGAQDGPASIRLNQLGFHPAAPKVAVLVVAADSAAAASASSGPATFAVLTADRGDTVLAGPLSEARRWAPSGEIARTADFGRLRRPGRYVLAVPGAGRSHPFAVWGDSASSGALARAAVKAFYFQRVSTPLPSAHAGRWARAAGHPDDAVLVHPSAAGPARAAGSRLAAPGGWYDAGDYNKYVVNSAISTYTLLALAEHFPDYARSLGTNIPESRNALPDVLDEALWNLRWMLAMQDPADGGVYHKLTNAEFDAMVMPDRATGAPRYVVQKSTAAALDLAATAAHAAALVARRYPRELPGLADTLVRAATAAWGWARRNPDAAYDQAALNARFAPPVNTGAYGDRRLGDELQWAAAELYLATKQDSFLVAAAPLAPPAYDVPSWGSVRALGLYSLVERRRELPAALDTAALVRRLLEPARALAEAARASAYGVAIGGGGERDFVWGSNAVAANQGMLLLQAYRATGDSAYLAAAAANLDYLLGRNATGYSFVTGFGARPPRAPHHRPSQADTVADPVPGMLVGGPNPGQQDHCPGYPSRLPARSYLDDVCSYASNEIAINWNAPLAYLAGGIEAIYAGRR